MAGTNPPDPWTESSNLQSETLAFRERNGQWIDLAGIGGRERESEFAFHWKCFARFAVGFHWELVAAIMANTLLYVVSPGNRLRLCNCKASSINKCKGIRHRQAHPHRCRSSIVGRWPFSMLTWRQFS